MREDLLIYGSVPKEERAKECASVMVKTTCIGQLKVWRYYLGEKL